MASLCYSLSPSSPCTSTTAALPVRPCFTCVHLSAVFSLKPYVSLTKNSTWQVLAPYVHSPSSRLLSCDIPSTIHHFSCHTMLPCSHLPRMDLSPFAPACRLPPALCYGGTRASGPWAELGLGSPKGHLAGLYVMLESDSGGPWIRPAALTSTLLSPPSLLLTPVPQLCNAQNQSRSCCTPTPFLLPWTQAQHKHVCSPPAREDPPPLPGLGAGWVGG